MLNQTLSLNDIEMQLQRVRNITPLVHCMTNDVVQGFTANVLLAVGASPAMVIAQQESAEFAAIADGLLINVGTITAEFGQAMLAAINAANQHNKPWVLDPVAVGVLSYRTQWVQHALTLRPTVIRGNASEILALAGATSQGKGVDSLDDSAIAVEAAKLLAKRYQTIVAVTGEVDFITDGSLTLSSPYGAPIMTRVVGTGCALSAMVAAFIAGAEQPLHAVAAACSMAGLAGQYAANLAAGTGTFQAYFLDALNKTAKELMS